MQQLDSPSFEPLADGQITSLLSWRTPEPPEPLPLPAHLQQLVDAGTIDRAAAEAEARFEAAEKDALDEARAEAPEQLLATSVLQACASNLRGIAWHRQSHVRWPKLIERAIFRVQCAAIDPSSRVGLRLFPESTPLPGRARDGRGRDERERPVYLPARVNTANVLSVILGWADLSSGLVAEKPKPGRAGGWKHKSWADVGAVAFGWVSQVNRKFLSDIFLDDTTGVLCVEKRTARAVARLEALGFIEVTQIREPTADRASWRSRIAVKRVTQKLWAALGLIKDFMAVLHARKRERAQLQKAARESAQHAGERARQAQGTKQPALRPALAERPQGPVDEGPPRRRELPVCVIALNEALGIA